MTQILIFRDSIAYGAWDLEGGLAQRLRKFLDEKVTKSGYKEYYMTYNLGVDGDTSAGLLKRFEAESKPRISSDEEIIFLFHIGDNDSLYNNKTKKFWVSLKDFEENIHKIIQQAKKYSKKIIFIGSAPVDESRTDPIPWVENCSYKNEYMSQFREVANKICAGENCYFIDLSKSIPTIWNVHLPDGVHPNTEGYKEIFRIIKSFLIKNKII